MSTQISMIAARVDAGISQKEMAKLVDRSNNTVLAWEKGRKAPSTTDFYKYCAACGRDPSEVRMPVVLE
jgi:DNA-binding XRE family transcriptional regulator